MKRLLRGIWRGLRHFCGDDAYERYLREQGLCRHPHPHMPLDRREFYAQREARKWSSIQRCC